LKSTNPLLIRLIDVLVIEAASTMYKNPQVIRLSGFFIVQSNATKCRVLALRLKSAGKGNLSKVTNVYAV
jgi:hypothetical protein